MIEHPIAYAPEDQKIADEYAALTDDEKRAKDYWADETTKELRGHVKSHYIAEQNHRCCYCGRHLGSKNHRLWDVEHIASQSEHPRFVFEPRNLAASCVDCNIAKSKKTTVNNEALVNKRRVTYPTRSADFRIVHPHFDDLNDHILIIGWVYVPKTDKGRTTIYVCDLLRFAQNFIDWKNKVSDSRFEKDVDELVEGENPGVVEKILAKLGE